jgi:hypothetical protein
VGQDDTLEALRFGLEMPGLGQNVFVRGLAGTGRLSLVRQLLDDVRPTCPLVNDRCYVHNFAQPDHPRLLTIPRSHGATLSCRIDELITFIQHDLGPLLSSDTLRARQYLPAEGEPLADRTSTAGRVAGIVTLAQMVWREAPDVPLNDLLRVRNASLLARIIAVRPLFQECSGPALSREQDLQALSAPWPDKIRSRFRQMCASG